MNIYSSYNNLTIFIFEKCEYLPLIYLLTFNFIIIIYFIYNINMIIIVIIFKNFKLNYYSSNCRRFHIFWYYKETFIIIGWIYYYFLF